MLLAATHVVQNVALLIVGCPLPIDTGSWITLDVYTQAVTSNKRAAQSKVVRMMVPNAGTLSANVGTMDSGKIAVNARY